MSWHWWHITLSYGAVLGGFAALSLMIAARIRAARKNLARLERH
jgi:hypothetical protein